MKCFRYENPPHYVVTTEAKIRELIDSGRLDAAAVTNAEAVLALGIGEQFEIGRTGAIYTRIADDATQQEVSAIVCRQRERARACGICGVMTRNGRLCDGPGKGKGKKSTCDRFMCTKCAVPAGPNRDFCPEHAKQLEMGHVRA